MTTDDLRQKAREAAAVWASDDGMTATAQEGYEEGYLAHAAQQPSQSDIADTMNHDGWTCTAHQPEPFGGCEDCTMLQMRTAKRVLRLLNGEERA